MSFHVVDPLPVNEREAAVSSHPIAFGIGSKADRHAGIDDSDK